MNKTQFLRQFYNVRQVSYEPDYPLSKPGYPAAVLMPLINREPMTMLFTRRASHLRHHGGQVSFPGGRMEIHDDSLLKAALRETEEEIGISHDQVEIIGQLGRYRTISGFEVTPYIGIIDPPLDLKRDHNEVASIFEVPLSYLMNKKNHLVHYARRKDGQHPIYFIHWQQQHIWGATAAFVRNLSNHLGE
ncbi:CoA pyrophosphatase [Lacimicrobium alkaliphilum]|uniref:Coenzyme A pyrophosphatase n=1 Tax=Lacimicrobium alkaliphilum TaxID=1526571 RepID=A0ABQ1R1V2_9ALTE|nr:CoA pyrophosphatase [Lacimicrobium alkaliphilum]GGD55195.1 coenzyme A pyrophosphatase [Lacimicrobium alkaliphilum]